MKWIAQVAHVARKDVRQVSWMLLLYSVTIAIAAAGMMTGKSFGPYSPTPNSVVMGMPDSFVAIIPGILTLMGVMVAASIVQLDSPTRANAFWSTRPLSPTAVLIAKFLVTIFVIIGLGTLGAAVALRSLDTGPMTMLRIVAASGVSSIQWTLAVILVAAMTRDLREFAVGLVAPFVAVTLLLWAFDGLVIPISSRVGNIFTLLLGLCALWFVFKLYRTRERGRGALIVGYAMAVLLLLFSLNPPPSTMEAPTLSGGAPLQMSAGSAIESRLGATVLVKLRIAERGQNDRLAFTPDSGTVRLNDGSRLSVNPITFATSAIGGAIPSVGKAVHWINVDSAALEWPSSLSIQPFALTTDSVATKISSVTIGGVVTVSRSEVIASLPLRHDAVFIKNGRRVLIRGNEGVEIDGNDATVHIQLSSVRRWGRVQEPEAHIGNRDNLQFAIVNDALGEAMLLDAAADEWPNTGSVVLPQITLSTSFDRYSTRMPFSGKTSVPRDGGWYKHARLVIIEWTVVGQYRTVAETKVE